jgi:hypothetical protein
VNDLTVIMLTANKLPDGWAAYHRATLEAAIGDTPLITISAKPLDWGVNLIQDGYGVTNLWRQMLRGAEMAETPFVAIAEDDTLYPACHFEFRPPAGAFGYNFHRWQTMTWKRRAFYYLKTYPANGLMIAHRDMMVAAIKARLDGVDELVSYRARELGSSARTLKWDGGGMVSWYSALSTVSLCHDQSVDTLSQRHRKVPWPVQATAIPYWGKAKWVVGRFQ